MREILFKAKRKDNGEWVEGYYRADPDLDMHYICGWNYYPSENGLEREPFEYEINPETLCQYIGLKDKNGKKIWENDIVKCRHSQSFGNVKWYCGDYIGWCVDDVYDCEQQFDKDMFDTCEVIGNVFDNPELLEVE